jgi:TonB family protein
MLSNASRVFRLESATIFCLLSLLLAGCAHISYQDRARTPLKPMQTVTPIKSQDFDVPPRVLEGKRPDYPEPEGANREKGFVSIICTIDAKGQLIDFDLESATSPSFAIAALNAISQWKFAPATKNGHPVTAKIRVPMHFNAI